MIRNYILVALRNLRKNKLFSFVNIFGLALSLSVCLLVILLIFDQNSFDQFHPNPEAIYRINTTAIRKGGGTEPYASTPFPIGAVIKSENPAIDKLVRLTGGLRGEILFEQRKFTLKGFFTEPSFFEMFGFEFAAGDPKSALSQPEGLILSDAMAKKIFGEENPIGKSVAISDLGSFKITGVLKPNPGKTHFEFDALGSILALGALEAEHKIGPITDSWTNYYFTYTYVRLKKGSDVRNLKDFLSEIPKRFYGNLELESRDAGYVFETQRLQDITPGPILSNSLGNGLPSIFLIFLSLLAGISMIAALFNYTNLTLARGLTRAREVGIRKVHGAARYQLFFQFVGESVIVALLSLGSGEVLLDVFLIPGFRSLQFTGSLEIDLTVSPAIHLCFVAFAVLIGMIGGLIPAWILSSFHTHTIMKNMAGIRIFSKLTMRKTLLMFQFGLTFLFVIVLTTIYFQTRYAMKMDYFTFAWEKMINIELHGKPYRTVATEIARYPDVAGYSAVSHVMGTWADDKIDVRTSPDKELSQIRDYSVDENFLANMNIRLVEGRNFEKSESVRDEIMVNQKFLQQFDLGLPETAVGKTIYLEKNKPVHIIGVVRDFLYKPLTYELESLVLRYDPDRWNVLQVRLQGSDFNPAISFFQNVWKRMDPAIPMAYKVYAYELSDAYSLLEDLTRIIGLLSELIFTISILGLLGIAAYTTETRIKEIGIRKVLGASAWNLMVELSRQYIAIVLIAAILFVPLSLFIGAQILSYFAFHIESGMMLAVPAVAGIFFMVILTVGWQAFRAATGNPVNALKYE